ncbi:hypothetical protein [Acinetobacter soli]|uniref:hypothetical protein n=1 Tax=Acinetobacter soli TaxID=487316 RepID=UPI003709EC96
MTFDHQGSMSPICPHCHSPHTLLLDTRQLSLPVQHSPLATFSPMTLATVGMHMAKRLRLPSLLGGFMGLVVGGMVLLYINYQKPIRIMHYQCEQCQQQFEIEQAE